MLTFDVVTVLPRESKKLTRLHEEHAAGAAQVYRLRLEDRQFSFLRFLSSFPSQQYAVFTHDPPPPCICPVMVLPFRLGHMIRRPWRAHYLTSVLQQQRDHPPSIKRIPRRLARTPDLSLATICGGKGKKQKTKNVATIQSTRPNCGSQECVSEGCSGSLKKSF